MPTTTASPMFLNRFTTLPFAIDLLTRKKLTLLNPSKWEDYNDRLTVELYKQRKGYNSIYVLCLTDDRENIHHWSAFANGTSGCCIEFDYNKLCSVLNKTPDVKFGKTKYIKLNDLGKHSSDDEELPFIKRHPFEPENEFRIVALSNDRQEDTFDIDIELGSVRRITINNKMPKPTFESVKECLLSIADGFQGKVYHSTLFDNQRWSKHFGK